MPKVGDDYYNVIYVDDFSHYAQIYLLSSKYNLFKVYEELSTMIQTYYFLRP